MKLIEINKPKKEAISAILPVRQKELLRASAKLNKCSISYVLQDAVKTYFKI